MENNNPTNYTKESFSNNFKIFFFSNIIIYFGNSFRAQKLYFLEALKKFYLAIANNIRNIKMFSQSASETVGLNRAQKGRTNHSSGFTPSEAKWSRGNHFIFYPKFPLFSGSWWGYRGTPIMNLFSNSSAIIKDFLKNSIFIYLSFFSTFYFILNGFLLLARASNDQMSVGLIAILNEFCNF